MPIFSCDKSAAVHHTVEFMRSTFRFSMEWLRDYCGCERPFNTGHPFSTDQGFALLQSVGEGCLSCKWVHASLPFVDDIYQSAQFTNLRFNVHELGRISRSECKACLGFNIESLELQYVVVDRRHDYHIPNINVCKAYDFKNRY